MHIRRITARDEPGRVAFASALIMFAGFAGCGGSSHAAPSCASVLRSVAPVTNKGTQSAPGTASTMRPDGKTPTLQVDAANSAFAPTCFTDVTPGLVSVTFHNTGVVIHNVEIPAQHIDADIVPRRSVTVRIRVGSDPVVYVCKYHRSLGMVGVLIPKP